MRWVTNEGGLCELECCGDESKAPALGKGCGWVSAGIFASSLFLTTSAEFADGTKLQHIHIKEASTFWGLGIELIKRCAASKSMCLSPGKRKENEPYSVVGICGAAAALPEHKPTLKEKPNKEGIPAGRQSYKSGLHLE